MAILNTEHTINNARTLAIAPQALKSFNLTSKDIVISYDGLTEFQTSMDSYKDWNNQGNNSSMDTGRESWTGSKDWDHYVKILNEGDEKVKEKIKEKISENTTDILNTYSINVDDFKRDVTGDFFNVADVLDNIPECWVQTQVEKEKQFIEIFINMSIACYVNADDVINNAARIIAVVNVLELCEISVGITLFEISSGANRADSDIKLAVLCRLKNPSEVIDYNKLSALLNPSFTRRAVFKVTELCFKDKVSSGYGRPINNKEGTVDIGSTSQTKEFEIKHLKLLGINANKDEEDSDDFPF